MKKLDNKKLSILSLFSVIGVLSMPMLYDNNLILLPILMCIIGGISFGTLIFKK